MGRLCRRRSCWGPPSHGRQARSASAFPDRGREGHAASLPVSFPGGMELGRALVVLLWPWTENVLRASLLWQASRSRGALQAAHGVQTDSCAGTSSGLRRETAGPERPFPVELLEQQLVAGTVWSTLGGPPPQPGPGRCGSGRLGRGFVLSPSGCAWSPLSSESLCLKHFTETLVPAYFPKCHLVWVFVWV